MTDEKLMEQARKDFSSDVAAEMDIRREACADQQFVAGDQWKEADRRSREDANRPCFTFNRLPAFVQTVSNEARANEISVKAVPVEDADVGGASVYDSIIKGIEYGSHAEVAYGTAVETSAACGLGYYRHATNYCDDETFDQEIQILPVDDPLSVYGVMIPAIFRRPVTHAFMTYPMSRDSYRAMYPKSKVETEWAFFDGGENPAPQWIMEDSILVAEYWTVEWERNEVVSFDPATGTERRRWASTPTVTRYVINGVEVLEKTPWVGRRVPIYPVFGKTMIVNGRPLVFSLVRPMREPQILINFAKTRIAEMLAVQPVTPFVGVEGQFAGHEAEWKTANSTLRPFLEYAQVTIGDKPAPPPQRQVFEAPINALSMFAAAEIEDLKATAAIYDASLGAQSNERSGIAIARRQQQSSIANYHYIDNLVRSMWESGRELVYMIPRIYDTPRQVRIVGEGGAPAVLAVNMEGTPRLDVGKYDVRVTTGPSYATKRGEAFARVTEMAKVYPALMDTAGDIVMALSDMPKADEIAKRLKSIIPAAQQGQEQQIPPQVVARIQQSDQMIEALTEQVKQLSVERDSKREELESRERIAMLQEETKRVVEFAKLDAQAGVEQLRQEVASIRAQQEMSMRGAMHEDQMEAPREAAEAAPTTAEGE